ncbi:MAG: hypothetical protein WBI40_07530 [Methylococcaceae bacterium]
MIYPKALYLGKIGDDYKVTIAENETDEKALRDLGYVDYADLGKKTKKSKSNTVEAVDDGNNELLNTPDSNSELVAP